MLSRGGQLTIVKVIAGCLAIGCVLWKMQRVRYERADADNCQIARWKGVEVVGKEGNAGGVHLIFIVCDYMRARRAAVFCRLARAAGVGR